MIKQSGDKWILYTHDGSKKLGTHSSKKEAEAQERAIHANESQNPQLNKDEDEKENNKKDKEKINNECMTNESLKLKLEKLIIDLLKSK